MRCYAVCAGHWLIIGTSFFGIVETAQLFFHLYEKPELGLKHVCHAQKVHTTIFVHIVTQEFLLCTLVCNYVRQYLHKNTELIAITTTLRYTLRH